MEYVTTCGAVFRQIGSIAKRDESGMPLPSQPIFIMIQNPTADNSENEALNDFAESVAPLFAKQK